MKNSTIFWIVFAIAAVLLLAFSGVFTTKEEKPLNILTIDSANTTIIVTDFAGTQIGDNSNLKTGVTYTLSATANEGYELRVLTINEEDILPNLVNNTYSFVCNGSVTIKAASISISSGEIQDTPTEYLSFNYLGSIITQRNLFGLAGVLNI